MKKHPIAVSAVAFFLLATGCQTPKEEVAVVAEPLSKKRDHSQPLTLEAVSEQNVHGGWQGKSAPYLNSGGFSVEADFIYWRVDEDGLDYVLTTNTTGSSTESTFHKPEIRWDAGFKVGAGYTWGHQDFWDLFLRWTHLNTHQSGDKKGSDLIPIWSPFILGFQALSASALWKVLYNTLDLEMGRDYFISRTIALRPYVGLRGASILQHYETKYLSEVLTDAPPVHTHMKAENNFRGLGARAGTQLKWHFTPSWAVIGSVAGSLLYGRFDLHQKLKDIDMMPMEYGLKDGFSKVITNLEANLGFSWETFFSKDRYRVAISVAYEFSEWFSQNRIKQFNLIDFAPNGLTTGMTLVGDAKGDLGLQGGTLQVRFDF